MPRADRAPSFQFYPSDWQSDPAVQALSWAERGRYFWALCSSAQTDDPGVATEAQWRRWMGYRERDWVSVRRHFSTPDSPITCFVVRADGMWVQKRLKADSDARRERYLQAKQGAAVTNEKRWGTAPSVSHSDTHSDRTANRSATRSAVAPASASASASVSEKGLKFGSTLPGQNLTSPAPPALSQRSTPKSEPVSRDPDNQQPNGAALEQLGGTVACSRCGSEYALPPTLTRSAWERDYAALCGRCFVAKVTGLQIPNPGPAP